MTLNIPADFYEVGMIMTRTGDPEPMQWSYGIAKPTPPDTDTAAGILAAWEDHLESLTSSVMTMQKVAFTSAEGLVVEGGTPAGGSASSSVLPSNTAVIVKKLTGIPGRAHRGRFYYPSVGSAVVDLNGMITSASVAALQGGFDDFFTAVVGVDDIDTIVLLHTGDLDPDPITHFTVEAQCGTQRRRMRP